MQLVGFWIPKTGRDSSAPLKMAFAKVSMTPVVRLLRTVLSAVFALVVAIPALQAANVTWTTGTSDGLWATGASWQGGIAPTTGDSVIFAATTGTSALTYDIANTAPAWGGITFNSGASAYTIASGTMTMAGGTATITNDSTSLQTINSVFGSGFTVAGSGSLTIGGRVVSGNITKNGTGMLTLSGSNTAYAGTITANAGTVTFAAANSTGTNTSLVLNGGGFRTVAAGFTVTVGSLAVTQSGTVAIGASSGNATTLKANILSGAGALTVSGEGATSGNLNRVFRLTGTNSGFSGTITVGTQSALFLENEAALGTNYANALTLAANSSLQMLNGGTVQAYRINVASGASPFIGMGNGSSGTATITSRITGEGGVTFRTNNGNSTVVLGGTNDYSGATTISSLNSENSVLRLAANNALPYGSGKGNLQFFVNGVGAVSTLDMAGFSLSVNGLITTSGTTYSYTREIVDNVSAGGASTLTLGNADASGTFFGVIRNTTGTIKLTKVGVGTQVLSGTSNTYGGGTDISAGTLQFSRIGSMPATGTVAVKDGGTLAVNLGGTGEFTFDTSGAGSIGGLLSGVGGQGNAVTWAGNVGLGIDTTSASGTYSGIVANVGASLGITKFGSNTLTLSGNNTYSGPTTVGAGTLVINGAHSGIGTINVNSGILSFGAAASSANSDIVIGNKSANTVSFVITNTDGGTRTISKSLSFNGYGPSGTTSVYSMSVDRSTTANSVMNFGALTLESGLANVSMTGTAVGTKNLRMNFDSLTINNGSLMWLNRAGSSAVNLGTASIVSQTGTSTNIVFTTVPTLSGTGSAGTTSMGILAGVYLTIANGPSTFATYDSTFGVRQLNGTNEQATLTSGMTAGQNAKVAANTTLTANTSVNSLLTSGTLTLGGNRLTVNSGMIAASNAAYTIGSSPGDGTLDFGGANGYIITDNSRIATINSVIAGSGGLTLAGMNINVSPNIDLFGANTVSGVARFVGTNAPTMVRLMNADALANLTLDYNNSGAGFTFGSSANSSVTNFNFGGLKGAQNISLITAANALAVTLSVGSNGDSTTYSGVLSGAGGSLIKAGSGALTLTGANTYTGATTITGGTLQIGNGATGALSASSAITNNGVLVFNRSDALTQGTHFSSTAISGTGSLIKAGAGSLSLTAANTYTGATIINEGTLALGVAGSFASSSLITVGGVGSFGATLDLTAKTSTFAFGAGQTLGGIGTVRMDAGDTVQIAGLLSPGNSPGILTFDGGTTLLSGTAQMEIFGSVRGTNYDAVDLVNNAIFDYAGGTLFLDFGSWLADPQAYQLFGSGSSALQGSLSVVTIAGSNYTGLTFTRSDGVWTSTGASPSGQTLTFTESTGQLVIVVPEPGAVALAGVGVAIAGWAVRRRRRIAEMPRNPHNP